MLKYKVGCPTCCGSFVETNGKFDGKQLAHESMIDVLPEFAGIMPKIGLKCPSCGGELTINSRFSRLQPAGNVGDAPEEVVKPVVQEPAVDNSKEVDELKRSNKELLDRLARIEKKMDAQTDEHKKDEDIVPYQEPSEESEPVIVAGTIPDPLPGEGDRVICPTCKKEMHPGSYQRHYQTQHIDPAMKAKA